MTTTYNSVIERILQHDDTILTQPGLLKDVYMDSGSQLFLLFSACYDSKNVKAIPWILDNLKEETSYVDPESSIFTLPILSTELLTFVVTSAPSRFSLANCIDCLIQLDSTDKIYGACVKALEVLGDTDFVSWVNFSMTADDFDNEAVQQFCQIQAKRVAPYRKKPKYIIPCPGLGKVGEMEQIEVNPPQDTPQEVLDEEVKKLEQCVERFRFLGPANFIIGASSRDILSGEAEMRMFEDNRFIDDPEDQFASWFTGNCDECWYKIKDKRYSVRKPLQTGGWIGQFCSWECVRDNCEEKGQIIEHEMARYYETQMNKNKIYNNISKK